MEDKFRMIEEMGFSRNEAQDALTYARGDLQAAIDWLLTNCPQGITGVSAAVPKPNVEGGKPGNSSSEPNFVPSPPLDASDSENAQHLEALKRNQSNEIPRPANGAPSAPKQPQQTPPTIASSPSPSTPSKEPNSPNQTQQSAMVLSAGQIASSSIMINAPAVQVCYREGSDAPTLSERDRLFDLLQKEHIPCVLLNIHENKEMEDVLASQGVSLPQAVLTYQPLGDLNEFSQNLGALRRLVAQRIASGLQSEHSSTMDEYSRADGSIGAVDGMMNLLASAASKLWSQGGSPSPNRRPTHTFIEFTVIKTNWFYRDQRRIIRFGTTGDFYRIEPKTNELRETIPYSSITAIAVGPSKLTLTLTNGLLHSFTAPARVIDYMYQLFLAYSPESVIPTIETS